MPWSDDAQRALWQDMADMGWLGLLASEDQGGLGLGMCEAYLVAEAAGRQLLNLPLAASAVLLPLLLQESTQRNGWLATWVEDVAAGRSAFNVAFDDMRHLDHAQQCSHQLLLHGLDMPEAEVRLALLPVDATNGASAAAKITALDPTFRDASLSVGVDSSCLDWHVLEISAQGRAYALACYRLARSRTVGCRSRLT
ncbi:acyl-CoA dehydrogenase family protein (plasmid) [Polaromonas sp. P1-6]|nr:acyl-CoA dehydrogenase family protein [Polaromonas sp. P1-6]